MKIDLQIQTTFSDGIDTPTEVVEMAKNANITHLSITDHNTFGGTEEARKAVEGSDIKIITGMEVTCEFQNNNLHILVYNFDTSSRKIEKLLTTIQLERKAGFTDAILRVNERLSAANLPNILQSEYENSPTRYHSTPGIATFMLDKGIIQKRDDATQFTKGTIQFHLSIEPKEVIEAAHEAGGVAVLSHPLRPHISLRNISDDETEQEKIIAHFAEIGLDGLECYTPGHTSAEITRVKKYAEKYNLHITAGSDWHGDLAVRGKNILEALPYYLKNFGDLEVPDEDTKAMIDWLF